MTNELKEKILAWVERITRYKGNDFILDEETNELLAIIDEGVEEATYEAFERGRNTCIRFVK